MAKTKTGLLYSELTGSVYWGTVNTETNIARAGKKDVTSDFISVMLQKFPVGFSQNIVCNGELEAVIYVVDEKTSNRIGHSKEMLEMLSDAADALYQSIAESDINLACEIRDLLAKARGETTTDNKRVEK